MNRNLPIHEVETKLIQSLRDGNRLILEAPTGSGKSTQVPQILFHHGLHQDRQILILQPRRLPTRMLAARVAHEMKVTLGDEVGYHIRLDHVASKKTRIKYITEGVLLRYLLNDPVLSDIQIILFDEFHERHLHGDISLARTLDIQEKTRPDLKLIVMSATLEAATLKSHLNPCEVLTSQGRTYPVEISYSAPQHGQQPQPVWEHAAEAFQNESGAGDTLIFMPGSYEIHRTIEALQQTREAKQHLILPLHGELPPRDQDAAVAQYDRPKIVVTTNVAETSLTIDGIRLVIDSGLARIPKYDPHRGINTLLIQPISHSSADQRAGRAGRTAPGRCIRLWSQRDHTHRAKQELPEIQRLDLSEVILMLKATGVGSLKSFRWIDPPTNQSLEHAMELLTDLTALDHHEEITELGRRMLSFPIHPRYSRMMLAAQEHRCVYQVALISALTQGRDLLIRNPGKEVERFREERFGDEAASDFLVLMRAWNYAVKNEYRIDACRRAGIHAVTARQVGPLLEQFLQIAKREKLDTEPRPISDESLQQCILSGFSDRVARRLDEGTLRCELVHGRRGTLVRESVVRKAPYLVVAEAQEIGSHSRGVDTLLTLATAIQPEWLQRMYPQDVQAEVKVVWDAQARRVSAMENLCFRGLPIRSKRMDPPPEDESAHLLAHEVMQGRIPLPQWDHEVDQWILRLNQLRSWCPELELPLFEDKDKMGLIEQICHGSSSARHLKDAEVKSVVRSWLSSSQQDLLDKHAPERIPLPGGRRAKVTYSPESLPFIAVRLQELYGVQQTPRIAMNRVSLLVHLLAPNMRPVQITQDLASFWRDQYPKVKQELQRKYPKHKWE